MRLARLDLTAYGQFAGQVLEFGAGPGLHLILGANEAGKSTTLRALSAVLFGYPHAALDTFRHGARDIALGAELVGQGGQRLSFSRRRGRGKLFDADGGKLAEMAVADLLGGVSREVFERVFALDHRRLHEHAEALLAAGGQLGVGLVEAGAGLAGIRATLDRLSQAREALFVPAGHKRTVNQLIHRLAELRAGAIRHTVSPEKYRKLQQQVAACEERLDLARSRRRGLAAAGLRLERIRRNLGRGAEHAALTAAAEALAIVPLLPDEAPLHRAKAESEAAAAARAGAEAAAALAALDAELAALAPDPATLSRQDDIERLAEWRGNIQKSQEDLPRKRAELRQLRLRAAALLAEAGLPDDVDGLGAVLLPAPNRKALADLIEAHRGLAARRAAAEPQAARAAADLRLAEQRLAATPPPPDITVLRAAVKAAEAFGEAGENSAREQSIARRRQALAESVRALRIASGQVGLLRRVAAPQAAAAERAAEAIQAVDRDIGRVEVELARLEADISAKEDTAFQLRLGGELASEDDLAEARLQRDSTWAQLKVQLAGGEAAPAGTADRLEAQIEHADRVGDLLRRNAGAAGELAALGRDLAAAARRRDEAGRHLAGLRARRLAILQDWEALWDGAGLTPLPPAETLEWLAARERLLAEAAGLDTEAAELEALAARREAVRRRLAAALDAEASLEALREQGRAALDAEAEARLAHDRAREALAEKSRNQAAAVENLGNLEREAADWRQAWGKALARAGLDRGLEPEQAGLVLEILVQLAGLKAQIDGLGHRIETMQADIAEFAGFVRGLAGDLDPAAAALDPVPASRLLEQRLKAASAAEATGAELARRRHSLEAAAGRAAAEAEAAAATLARLCQQAGAGDAAELPEIERRSAERRRLSSEIQALERRMLEDGGGMTLEALFAECAGSDADAVPGEIAALRHELEALESEIDALTGDHARQQAALDALLSQDQAAAFAQQAADTEAELEGAVETYVDITVQEVLIRAAVDAYRERNQGPVLARARRIFAELTDGAYVGLRADFGDRGEPVLLAERAGGGSLGVGELSDGTLDALYLALRLAVVREYNATREPLPFIADDLLLNLDDRRAAAAFRVLADMAAEGQVLFFTHHEHMRDLARAAVPAPLLVEHRLDQQNPGRPAPGRGGTAATHRVRPQHEDGTLMPPPSYPGMPGTS